MKIFNVKDSEAKPYIEQKDVILCRSGKQLYHRSELEGFISQGNEPKVQKDWYIEYRPASVVVKAQSLCKSLPVTKEHPEDWVTPQTFSSLAGGTTDKEVEIVALDGESEGEIGIKSNLTFYTDELYNYYKENKEVSLGYTCRKHWVDNPEEVGYDIILDEILEVNHLAITRAGRGGSSVAILDSIMGGYKPMKSGIFSFLAGKKQKDSNPETLGTKVLKALKEAKTDKDLDASAKAVLDSCALLKDCATKTTLMNSICDCFEHKDKALANGEELVETLDSMYNTIVKDSVEEIKDACSKDEEKTEDSEETKEEKTEDSEETKEEKTEDSEETKEEEKTEDSEETKEEEKTEDSEETKEEKVDEVDKNKDSAFTNKDDIVNAIKDSIKPMIQDVVKEVLGITENKDAKGSALDSNVENCVITRDYADFIDK